MSVTLPSAPEDAVPSPSPSPIRIGLVGLGKIAVDQHIPTLRADPRFELVAGVAPRAKPAVDIPVYPTLDAMIAATPELHAVALCTPPQIRCALAREALDRGLHVMLEKPPGMAVGEVEEVAGRARARHLALQATWHSRESPAVPVARAWLARRIVRKAIVTWKEDVRVWHPGQQWIWRPGGLGVFDPGINALSIITALLPHKLFVTRSVLFMPANRQAPIAVELALSDGAGVTVDVALDFRQSGHEQWDIQIETDAGWLEMHHGGANLQIDGSSVIVSASREYPRLYDCFAGLVYARRVDVDLAPFQIVADAFLLGERVEVEPFEY